MRYQRYERHDLMEKSLQVEPISITLDPATIDTTTSEVKTVTVKINFVPGGTTNKAYSASVDGSSAIIKDNGDGTITVTTTESSGTSNLTVTSKAKDSVTGTCVINVT